MGKREKGNLIYCRKLFYFTVQMMTDLVSLFIFLVMTSGVKWNFSRYRIFWYFLKVVPMPKISYIQTEYYENNHPSFQEMKIKSDVVTSSKKTLKLIDEKELLAYIFFSIETAIATRSRHFPPRTKIHC